MKLNYFVISARLTYPLIDINKFQTKKGICSSIEGRY